MLDAALDLNGLFGLAPGPTGFYGEDLPPGTSYDVGGHEASSD
jgi:hypothetical protein